MLFLAMKQLFSKKKQTVLILLGISFGTMLYIAISGIQLGFREYIINALLNNTAHILVSGREDIIDRELVDQWFYPNQTVHWVTPPYGKRSEAKLENYQGWATRLSGHEEVYDYCPRLNIQVMLRRGGLTHSLSLIGTEARRQVRVSKITDYMVEGEFTSLSSGGNKIILGIGAAEEIGVRVGQFVEVITGSLSKRSSFKVVGILSFGVYNVLSIMINQKRKEIAILRSIGYGPKRILELIMYQGIFLGLSGGVVGMVLGYIVSRLVESIELNINIGGSNHLLVDYSPSTYLISFVSALIASLIASFLPAISASRMTPIDIIRGE